jgi:hypothetical protein
MFTEAVTIKDQDGRDRSVVTRIPQFKTLYKYHTGRWHMERWRGPEFYGTSDEWYRSTWDEECQFHTMGDYPDRGDYEHVFYLGMCPHLDDNGEWCMPCQVGMGQYIDLEPNVWVLDMQIKALQESEGIHGQAQFAALFMREEIKRNINNKLITARVQEAMRPKLAVQPTSWQPGFGAKCSVPEPKVKFRSKAKVRTRQELGFSQMGGNKIDNIEEN